MNSPAANKACLAQLCSALGLPSLSVPHVLIPVRTGVYVTKSVRMQYLRGGFHFADFSLLLDSL